MSAKSICLTAGLLLCSAAELPAQECKWERALAFPERGNQDGPSSWVWDTNRGVAVLINMYFRDGIADRFTRTYEWDGSRWSVPHEYGGPVGRYWHAMAFDSNRNVTVLFGGRDFNQFGGVALGDTWEWDGTTWTLRSTTGPAPRDSHAMCFDSARGVTVMTGGISGGTWEWDGVSWFERSTGGRLLYGSPSAMVFDSVRNVIVAFDGSPTSVTSEWNGVNWTERSVMGPSPRSGYGMAFDPVRNRTVLFGGDPYGGGPNLNDTWEWDGTSWTQMAAMFPTTRRRMAMTYDPVRQKTIMYGGEADGTGGYGDIWSWDGSNWNLESPGWNVTAWSILYDCARGATVIYDWNVPGIANRITEWDGESLRQFDVPGTLTPGIRSRFVMSYDSSRRAAVLFGGQDEDGYPADTWEWNGAEWLLRSTTGPASRVDSAMAYDSGRNVTVMFSGRSDVADTWEWDGNGWVLRSLTGPSPRHHHGLAYDEARGVTVLFGGTSQGVNNETWEWDGQDWAFRGATGPPALESVGKRLSFDREKQVVVLFTSQSRWEWDGTSWTQTALTAPILSEESVFDSYRGRHLSLIDGNFGFGIGEYRCGTPAQARAWEAIPELPDACSSSLEPPKKNRYLSFIPPSSQDGVTGVALRITLEAMPGASDCPRVADFSASQGAQMWVGPEVLASGAPTGVYRLQPEPYFRVWDSVPFGVVHVSDCNIVPCATYSIDAITEPDYPSGPYSASLVLSTSDVWGDIIGGSVFDALDGSVDFSDISASVDSFKNATGSVSRSRCDLSSMNPTQGSNFPIDFSDISAVVDAFRGVTYPFAGPTAPLACP